MNLPREGWYPDPSGDYDLRWWNGTTWTSDTRAFHAEKHAFISEVSSHSNGGSAESTYSTDPVHTGTDESFKTDIPVQTDTFTALQADSSHMRTRHAYSPRMRTLTIIAIICAITTLVWACGTGILAAHTSQLLREVKQKSEQLQRSHHALDELTSEIEALREQLGQTP
ncbi:DUF2510 domain-containing protein [Schaalia sp. lx-100]|uniref:DUF2510 domain-containing protein n=1 Tax=Schaalia sp. lx-100 TaxID=2899081 RepID=UPI001E3047A4|nr:DUF2510 domain-containing protein [Schaalia sp. lx-100]